MDQTCWLRHETLSLVGTTGARQMGPVLQSLLGLAALPFIAWLVSEDRRAIAGRELVKLCAAGIALQLVLAIVLLRIPQSRVIFTGMDRAVAALQSATEEGLRFVFGYLAGGPAPFSVTAPEYTFVLAFRALPLILLMSVLSRLLYHWGILQKVVAGFSWALERTLGVGGALGTSAAANIFLGMVEAPLLIRPYIKTMGRGALFATMTVGMAGVAGTVMALYASFLERAVPGAAGHILVASIMSVPAALVMARIMVPHGFADNGVVALEVEAAGQPASAMDAIAQGTSEGVQLLAYVVAMLIVMIALVALANGILGSFGQMFGLTLTLQGMLGWGAAPLAWLIGIPWSEAQTAGGLIGIKTVLNELLAYLEMARTPEAALSPRSRLILTYGLCGFANLGSLGILIGGMTAMAPERRAEIVELAPRTILAGTLATLMTGAVVGLVVWP
jgi:concentrative nucleoside transporter, CNT family